jgi:predicted extracellular nuclease
MDELEILFKGKPLSSLNLHEREIRRREEGMYWEMKEEIDKIKQEEDKLETMLINLSSGIADEEEIKSLIPAQNEEEKQLSKKKRRILEEKQRLGTDPREIINEMYGEFGSEKMHLTTGRHATGVKNLGNVDPLTAAAEFYYRTADTHGGKVDYGKRSDSYVSPSGRRIRKK